MTLFRNADIVVKGDLLLLLAASIWSWTVIIEKLWRLAVARRSVARCEALAAASRSAHDLLAQAGAGGAGDPAGLVLAAGIAESAASERPEAETEDGRRERIERATLASAAPFIGLFGTVWGIMHSFAGIAAAHSTSLPVVAPGIAEALFATAMGLAAAVPAVVAYNKFTVDLGRLAGRMQNVIGRAGRLLCRAGG